MQHYRSESAIRTINSSCCYYFLVFHECVYFNLVQSYRYVALVATRKEEEHGNSYNGFHVIHLPTESMYKLFSIIMSFEMISWFFKLSVICCQFIANISVLDSVLTQLEAPKPSQIELFEKICKRLRFKYEHKIFANPSLASFYSNLEALVYDEEVQKFDDLSMPQCKDQDEKIGQYVDFIEEEFGAVRCEDSLGFD